MDFVTDDFFNKVLGYAFVESVGMAISVPPLSLLDSSQQYTGYNVAVEYIGAMLRTFFFSPMTFPPYSY